MKKVITYCEVKNRWVGMVYYNSGMIKKYFSKKPKIRQLKNQVKTAQYYLSVNATAENDW